MAKMKVTVGVKIYLNIVLTIFIFILNFTYNYYLLKENQRQLEQSAEIIKPSLDLLKDFKLMATNSQMLITNWVYLSANESDKLKLKQLHSSGYPTLRSKIKEKITLWDPEKPNEKLMVDSVLKTYEALQEAQKDIMGTLVNFDDYEDVEKRFLSENSIEVDVIPLSDSIIVKLNSIIELKQGEFVVAEQRISESFKDIILISFTSIIFSTVLAFAIAFFVTNKITKPLLDIKNIIDKISKGQIPKGVYEKFSNDEIGEMSEAVKSMIENFKSTSEFANEIGQGKFSVDFKPLNDKDVLGNSLVSMRDNLEMFSREESKRNWVTKGQALIGEILNKYSHDMDALKKNIVLKLVSFLDAQQAGLFLFEENENGENENAKLKLVSSYARSEDTKVEIEKGEGIIGEVWKKNQFAYIENIPKGYFKIESGLGESYPKTLLVTPLSINEDVVGVIEIASFSTYEPYQIDFLQKASVSIAITISNLKNNNTTHKLLKESTQMTGQLRQQEEELIEKMSDLKTAHEQLEKNQQQITIKEQLIDKSIIVIEVDKEFNITSFNQLGSQTFKYQERELLGQKLSKLAGIENAKKLRSVLKSGKSVKELLFFYDKRGNTVPTYTVVRNTSHLRKGSYTFFITNLSMLKDKLTEQPAFSSEQ